MTYLVLFLVGAIFVPVDDAIHVLTKTTYYPPEQLKYSILGIIPFWVPFLFGSAAVGAGIHTQVIRKKFPRVKPVLIHHVVVSAVVFLTMYFLSGVSAKTWATDAILAITGISLYLFAGEFTLGGFLQALGIVVGGCGFEIFLVHQGVFQYVAPHNELFGVAPWLPWLYLGVAVSSDSFIKWYTQGRNKKV